MGLPLFDHRHGVVATTYIRPPEAGLPVATYAALGETNKLISYRLGIPQPKVSTALKSAMRKLGVQTRPQLVEKLRGFRIVA
jgi:DNA-binding CsgD family transcriptional regulator